MQNILPEQNTIPEQNILPEQNTIPEQNIIPEKPFLSYDEMIIKLKTENKLLIYDEDYASRMLQSLSYYNLINGYQECFKDPTTNEFKDGISIEFLCRFHFFDKSFQHIFLKYCTYIEDTFKNHVSYVISKDFGVIMDDYLNPVHFRGYTIGNKTVNDVISNIKNNADTTSNHHIENPTYYYLCHHNHVPAWILFKNTNFTDVIDLYSFMRDEQKKQILQFFFSSSLDTDFQKEFFKVSITLIRKFRNRIAHNLKYFAFRPRNTSFSNRILTTISETIPSFLSKTEVKKNKRGKNDVYAFFLALFFLLEKPHLCREFLEEITRLIQQDKDISIQLNQKPLFATYAKITGLPQNLDERIIDFYTKNN